MFERAILHLDLDSFFVSVERLYDLSLLGKPVIVGGGERGVVASCSYEARAKGVRSAMPTKQALRLCPDALIVKGQYDRYVTHSRQVAAILAEEVPILEKASIDEFYADLSGMDKHIGTWQWAQALRQRLIRESGLPISMALASNKLLSKIATGEAKPNGEIQIAPGTEKAYLAPKPIQVIPFIGEATCKKLHTLGVYTVRQLSELPASLLQQEFGQPGLSLWRKAQGQDDSPVEPHGERKSISTETTFNTDITDPQKLKDIVTGMVMKLGYQLRKSDWVCSNVAIKIRYSNFNTLTRQKAIPYTANDTILLENCLPLFDQFYDTRQAVRLIGVRCGNLANGQQQVLDLFHSYEEENNLLQALDHIRNRFGMQAIARGNTLKIKDKQPENSDDEIADEK